MNVPSRYTGLTVNERLFDAGLMKAFDAAKRAADRAKLIRILIEVGVEDAAWSTDTILGAPQKLGLLRMSAFDPLRTLSPCIDFHFLVQRRDANFPDRAPFIDRSWMLGSLQRTPRLAPTSQRNAHCPEAD